MQWEKIYRFLFLHSIARCIRAAQSLVGNGWASHCCSEGGWASMATARDRHYEIRSVTRLVVAMALPQPCNNMTRTPGNKICDGACGMTPHRHHHIHLVETAGLAILTFSLHDTATVATGNRSQNRNQDNSTDERNNDGSNEPSCTYPQQAC